MSAARLGLVSVLLTSACATLPPLATLPAPSRPPSGDFESDLYVADVGVRALVAPRAPSSLRVALRVEAPARAYGVDDLREALRRALFRGLRAYGVIVEEDAPHELTASLALASPAEDRGALEWTFVLSDSRGHALVSLARHTPLAPIHRALHQSIDVTGARAGHLGDALVGIVEAIMNAITAARVIPDPGASEPVEARRPMGLDGDPRVLDPCLLSRSPGAARVTLERSRVPDGALCIPWSHNSEKRCVSGYRGALDETLAQLLARYGPVTLDAAAPGVGTTSAGLVARFALDSLDAFPRPDEEDDRGRTGHSGENLIELRWRYELVEDGQVRVAVSRVTKAAAFESIGAMTELMLEEIDRAMAAWARHASVPAL